MVRRNVRVRWGWAALWGAPRITESRIAISAVHREHGTTIPDTGTKFTDSQQVVEGIYHHPECAIFYALNYVVLPLSIANPSASRPVLYALRYGPHPGRGGAALWPQ